MKNGKPSAREQRVLANGKRVLDEYVTWQRSNPQNFDASTSYVAQDASRAISMFLKLTA